MLFVLAESVSLHIVREISGCGCFRVSSFLYSGLSFFISFIAKSSLGHKYLSLDIVLSVSSLES